MLFQKSLKRSFKKKLFFLFYSCMISTALSSRSSNHSSVSSNLLLIPSGYFFLSVTVFFSSVLFFFIIPNSLIKLLLCSSIILPSSVSIFIIITLNSLWVTCLSPFHLNLLVKLCLFSLFEAYSSIFSFCLILCVYYITLSVTVGMLLNLASFNHKTGRGGKSVYLMGLW